MKFLNALIAIFLVTALLNCKGKSTEKVKQKFKTEYAKLNGAVTKINTCKNFQIRDYSISLKERKSLLLRLNDCDITDMEAEANRVNSQLKEQVDFYCDIKKVTFEFVNDGKNKKVNYEGCEKTQ